MERLLDSQDLLHVIETEDSDRRQRAQVRNTLSEHCVPEIRDVFFSESLAPPYDVWINLLNKFGPTNTMLGDSAKSTLLRQRWKVGDDPGTFLNRIDSMRTLQKLDSWPNHFEHSKQSSEDIAPTIGLPFQSVHPFVGDMLSKV